MSQIPRNRPGRPRNPPAPPGPEKPKRKVGRQSKKDQQTYNEALRINEANFRLAHPELATASASGSVPSLPDGYGSQNASYNTKTGSTTAFPSSPFFRPVDIDEAESAFARESGQQEEPPRCQAVVWQDLWKMSVHLFRAAPQKLLCGRLKPDGPKEAEVYRELVFILAHPCWERDLSLVTHAQEEAVYTRSSRQAPPPFGPLGSQGWGLRLQDMLQEIRGEQQEPGGEPQLQASDVRAVRQGLDRLAHAFFENRTVNEYWKGLVCQTADILHALIPADAATTARWDQGCAAGGGLECHPQPPVNDTPVPASNIASRLRKRRKTHISDDESDDDDDIPPPVAKRPRGRPKRPRQRTPDPAQPDPPVSQSAEANAGSAVSATHFEEEVPGHTESVTSGGEADASQPMTHEDIGIGGIPSDNLDHALHPPPSGERAAPRSEPIDGGAEASRSEPIDGGAEASQTTSDRRQAPHFGNESTTTSGGRGASQVPAGGIDTLQTMSDGRAALQLPIDAHEASHLSREELAVSQPPNQESAVPQSSYCLFTMSGTKGGGCQAPCRSSEERTSSQSGSVTPRLTRGGLHASHPSNRGAETLQPSHGGSTVQKTSEAKVWDGSTESSSPRDAAELTDHGRDKGQSTSQRTSTAEIWDDSADSSSSRDAAEVTENERDGDVIEELAEAIRDPFPVPTLENDDDDHTFQPQMYSRSPYNIRQSNPSAVPAPTAGGRPGSYGTTHTRSPDVRRSDVAHPRQPVATPGRQDPERETAGGKPSSGPQDHGYDPYEIVSYRGA